ncbi:hypothetical protein KQX54_015156 [Cotesia glomerata]|uniref:Uncharacterized protein n=2 Tax=Cotesia glomerata TaxID=32391 RepID=A0AAV7I4W6_COTGL|nr:hypothetical protein KQX54_015156 [Cotesia glomerata]
MDFGSSKPVKKKPKKSNLESMELDYIDSLIILKHNNKTKEAVTRVPKILFLSGVSGCGKTAALKVLARENKLDIVEWITPAKSAAYLDDDNRIVEQADKFF